MKLNFVNQLVCPRCPGDKPLAYSGPDGSGEIETGSLECASCRTNYPIRDGIPRFVPSTNYADSFGFQWNLFHKTQLDEYWGAATSGERFRNETRWPTRLDGELVLEAGCGMGRFTAHAAATGAEIFCVDYSNAVDAARRNNRHLPNVHYVQADIYHLPFRKGQFDRLFCFGVLQHCPDPRGAFLSLVPLLRSGGYMAADVYRLSWRTLFFGYYYVRLLTKGRQPDKLFPWVRRYFDLAYAITARARRISVGLAGKLSMLSGITDYWGIYDLPPDRMRELCLLDTFDKLSPAHDHPQTLRSARRWCEEARLTEVRVHPGYNGIEIHGRKG
jgi:SAM-dependent methyltransferase